MFKKLVVLSSMLGLIVFVASESINQIRANAIVDMQVENFEEYLSSIKKRQKRFDKAFPPVISRNGHEQDI